MPAIIPATTSATMPSTLAATIKESYHNLCKTFQGKHRVDLITQLTANHHWQTERADHAVTQYLMFLSLASIYKDQSLVPTADIDCVWEADILQDTARYVQLCEHLCGDVIHHVSQDNVEFNKIEKAFNQTLALFSQQFGIESLGERPSTAACGVLIRPD